MKKIIGSILTSSLVASTASLVVSCRHMALNQGLEGTRLTVVTDAGPISDRAFNEEIYQAVQIYSNREPNGNQGGFDFKNLGYSAQNNFVQPLKSDYESYVSSYKLAKYKGTDIFVLVGFQHEMSRKSASKIAGPEKTVIIVDSAVLEGEKNVIPISFHSQLAGFAAAYDSAVWATTIDPTTNKMKGQVYEGKNGLSFGVYGGISIKNATGSYLWGFLSGMAYFNARVAEENQNQRHLKLANFGVNGELSELNGVQPTDNRFFSGSFAVGGANQAGITDLLGPNSGKADVIFSAAGIQILDTLSTNNRAYVIGVDTNQALQFPEYQNRFVTNATKDLKNALYDAFDHSKANRLNHAIVDGDLGELIDDGPAQGDFWDGTLPTPKNYWSHDLDQTTEETGTKIPKTLIDFEGKDQEMAQILIDFFNQTGPDSSYFLAWEGERGIRELINQLIGLEQKLPISFS